MRLSARGGYGHDVKRVKLRLEFLERFRGGAHELEQRYSTYVVCAWLGNTPTIAHKHYLMVTNEHFETAAKTGDSLGMQTPVSPTVSRVARTRKRKTEKESNSAVFAPLREAFRRLQFWQ